MATEPVTASASEQGTTTSPALSLIIPTPSFEAIAELVDYLRAQTIRDRIELVVVAPSDAGLTIDEKAVEGLAGTKIVEVDALVPLGRPRAEGVRAASAPIVVFGETHALPEPKWAEALVAAHAEGWDVVTPTFTNANPDGGLSWSGFLLDYGANAEPVESTVPDRVPMHNGSYRRSVLLEYEPELDVVLDRGSFLTVDLKRTGRRLYRSLDARIAHLNVTTPWDWVVERYLGARMMAAGRSHGWPLRRRLTYILGAPLIPAVIVRRHGHEWQLRRRVRELPTLTVPLIGASLLLRAIGEAVGYARRSERAEAEAYARLAEYEIHKRLYVRPQG